MIYCFAIYKNLKNIIAGTRLLPILLLPLTIVAVTTLPARTTCTIVFNVGISHFLMTDSVANSLNEVFKSCKPWLIRIVILIYLP